MQRHPYNDGGGGGGGGGGGDGDGEGVLAGREHVAGRGGLHRENGVCGQGNGFQCFSNVFSVLSRACVFLPAREAPAIAGKLALWRFRRVARKSARRSTAWFYTRNVRPLPLSSPPPRNKERRGRMRRTAAAIFI